MTNLLARIVLTVCRFVLFVKKKVFIQDTRQIKKKKDNPFNKNEDSAGEQENENEENQ